MSRVEYDLAPVPNARQVEMLPSRNVALCIKDKRVVVTGEPIEDKPPKGDTIILTGTVRARLGTLRPAPLRWLSQKPEPTPRDPAPKDKAEIIVPQVRPVDPDAQPTLTEPAPAETPQKCRAALTLSPDEHHTFREIARALGARFEGDETPPPEALAPPPPPPPVPISAGRRRSVARGPQDITGIAAILDRVPISLLISRGDATLFANRACLDLLGYSTLDDLIREGGLSKLFHERNDEARKSDGRTTSIALTTKKGIIPVEARLASIDWQGLPASLLSLRPAFDPDLSPKVRALELHMRAHEARLREMASILDTATDGVIVLDDAGRILSLNRSAEALFGYDQNEVTGEPITLLFAPESHDLATDYLEGLRSNGVASLLNDGREITARVRQGGHIPLFMTMGRVSDQPERKFCAVLRDVTAFKKAESELLASKRAAEQASAQKSDFLAKISHEIRTPLNAIIGFAEVMQEERFGPVGNERYKDYLNDIRSSGAHVISLINDLLDLAKIEAGRLELSFASVNLNELVGQSISLMLPQAARDHIVMRHSFAEKLPPIVADERSMRQIILNLVSNAIKFTDAGGQVIISTALTDRGEVAFRVRDTGIGMNDKDIAEALEPFRQLATSRKSIGTGLGLPLTKALVEANRGALHLTSARDEGTLAEVIFPPTRVLAE
jgi:PAS domain S-box-containing protein